MPLLDSLLHCDYYLDISSFALNGLYRCKWALTTLPLHHCLAFARIMSDILGLTLGAFVFCAACQDDPDFG